MPYPTMCYPRARRIPPEGLSVLVNIVRNAGPRQLSDLGAGRMSERKAVIKNADMAEDMTQDAIDCATQVRCRLQDA